MVRNPGLSLRIFIKSIDPFLVEKYFTSRIQKRPLVPYYMPGTGMPFNYVKELLAGLEDEQTKTKIGTELRRINDVSRRGMNILRQIASEYNIAIDEDTQVQQIAMKMFLEHPEVFRHIWDLCSYYQSKIIPCEYFLDCDEVGIDNQKISKFRGEIQQFFSNQASGPECIVNHYENGKEILLAVTHGSQIKTVPRWVAGEVVLDSYRPAHEDSLLYDRVRSVLKIKASRKDQAQYYKSYCRHILGQPDSTQIVQRGIYDLNPLAKSTFRWEGNSKISSIVVVETRLKAPGETEPVITIKSSDVKKTFDYDFDDFDFSSGEILYVRFRVIIETDDGPEKVTFAITPPNFSDLTRVEHCDVISEYLKKNKVLLL
jgi:hypothetical protein